jgi:dethiobiotin synthetase
MDVPVPTLFVTATDTEVGKTAVAAGLAALLKESGRDVGVIKPVASGCDETEAGLVSADGVCLARAAGVDDAHERVCPVRLRHPLAPTVAAELEGRELDLSAVWEAVRVLSERHDALIVEGIGGIMVPVAPGVLVADVAAELGAPLLVVARPSLGTINHTLLTVAYARSRGLSVAAVLLNAARPGPAGDAERTNPSVIAEWAGCPVLGPLETCAGVSVEAGRLGELPARLGALAGLDGLMADVFGA